MPFYEFSRLFRARARQLRKSSQISSNPLRQARPELQLADDHVAGSNPLLRKEHDEPRVTLAEVMHPSIGIDENHYGFHAERLAPDRILSRPGGPASCCPVRVPSAGIVRLPLIATMRIDSMVLCIPFV